MDIKTKYNKDKTVLHVKLSVKRASRLTEERMYTTDDVITELEKKNIKVSSEQCVSASRLYNFRGDTQLSGVWTFSVPPPKAEPIVPKKKLAPKPTSPVSPPKTASKRRPQAKKVKKREV